MAKANKVWWLGKTRTDTELALRRLETGQEAGSKEHKQRTWALLTGHSMLGLWSIVHRRVPFLKNYLLITSNNESSSPKTGS